MNYMPDIAYLTFATPPTSLTPIHEYLLNVLGPQGYALKFERGGSRDDAPGLFISHIDHAWFAVVELWSYKGERGLRVCSGPVNDLDDDYIFAQVVEALSALPGVTR